MRHQYFVRYNARTMLWEVLRRSANNSPYATHIESYAYQRDAEDSARKRNAEAEASP